MAKVRVDVRIKMINDAINNTGIYEVPAFPSRLYTVKMENGVREIVKEIPGTYHVVSHVHMDDVISDILTYSRNAASGNMQLNQIVYNQAVLNANDWKASSTPIEKPAMVLFRNDPSICYHRLDFEPDRKMPTPLFDELMSRCSDPVAVQSFVGSLLEEKSDTQQYMWLFGDGCNGKGCLIRFMRKLIGHAATPKEAPVGRDKFWTHSLLGKRLVTMADCDDTEFVRSGLFKSLTGGDEVPMQAKGGHEFAAKTYCKFIIGSNEKPRISRQESDLRRVMYVTFKPIGCEKDGTYEDRLWLEASGIVAKSLDMYDEKVGNKHGSIPTVKDAVNDLIEENEENLDYFFDRYFDLDDRENVLEKDKYRFSGMELQRLMEDCYGNNYAKQRSDFVTWLRTKHGVYKKPIGGNRGKYYVGAKRNGIFSFKKMMIVNEAKRIDPVICTLFEEKKDQ